MPHSHDITITVITTDISTWSIRQILFNKNRCIMIMPNTLRNVSDERMKCQNFGAGMKILREKERGGVFAFSVPLLSCSSREEEG